jgi:ABC-type multidrug transport system fused ATPase/permease subunit
MRVIAMSKIRDKWQSSTLRRSLGVLSKSDRRKVAAVMVIQISMGVLDLLGVLAIGLLGALSVTGIQSGKPGDRVSTILDILRISDFSFQRQATVIGISAVLILVGRTALSIFFTRRILFFLSRRGAKISSDLISRLLAQPLLNIQSRSIQETLFAVTTGVSLITLQVLAVTVVLVSDLALLLIMAIGLLLIDTTTAALIFLMFAFIGYFLYKFMGTKVVSLGQASTNLIIKSNEKITEVFDSYRESVVRNRRDYYSREIGKLRFRLADHSAELTFMPYVSKYVIETAVIVGALLISGIMFLLQDAKHAVATLAIFLAAGTRIAPAVLRIQQSLLQIRGSLGQATPTLDLIDDLGNLPLVENVVDTLDLEHHDFVPEVSISNVTMTYPGKVYPAVTDINLMIPQGSLVAFVGPSGAGKTTIVDILLGVLNPDKGEIMISGLKPQIAVTKWPGAIGYVPQDVAIAAGTLQENIALGYPKEVATKELLQNALKVAHLQEFVASLPDGLETEVGERGAKISGGQRQRLGIARAMFTQPRLLVMDEATSSLDGETEFAITEAIKFLHGKSTIIMIAHRLSTIREADLIVYMDKGRIVSTGSFDTLRQEIPDFDKQAKLMGL